VGCRRESKQQQARGGIAETGNGPAPVRVVAVRAFLFDGDPLAVRTQARAAIA
jgi:hypothetical protein